MNTKVPSLRDQGKEYDGFTITITGDKYVSLPRGLRAGVHACAAAGLSRGLEVKRTTAPCVASPLLFSACHLEYYTTDTYSGGAKLSTFLDMMCKV